MHGSESTVDLCPIHGLPAVPTALRRVGGRSGYPLRLVPMSWTCPIKDCPGVIDDVPN